MPHALELCCAAIALVSCAACGADDDDAAGSDAGHVDASFTAADASCSDPVDCWQTEGFGPDEATTGEGPIAAALDGAGGLHVAYVASTETASRRISSRARPGAPRCGGSRPRKT